MKRAKFLYRIILALIMVVAIGVVVNSGMDKTEKTGTLAFSVIIGSLAITKESDTAGAVIFDKILEDWNGGAVLARARLKDGTTQIPKGALLYILDGIAQIVKTATGITGGTTTAIRVNKSHQFKVGEHIMIEGTTTSQTITAIDTTNDAYDIISIAATIGTITDGTVIVEAAAQGTTPVPLYVANSILKDLTDVQRANPSVSGVVRGSVRGNELPYGAYVDDIAALNLIRFV